MDTDTDAPSVPYVPSRREQNEIFRIQVLRNEVLSLQRRKRYGSGGVRGARRAKGARNVRGVGAGVGVGIGMGTGGLNGNEGFRKLFGTFVPSAVTGTFSGTSSTSANSGVSPRGGSSVALTMVEQRQLARRVAQMRKQEGGLLGEGRVVREVFFAVGDGTDVIKRFLIR
jgi:hypothetical protein